MSDIAKRDQNYVPAMQGVSSVDGLTLTDVHVDPITNEILVKSSISGSIPLPTGAATLAEQQTQTTHLAAIEAAVEGTISVSAASLPLPTGASTAANQSTIITHLDGVEGLLTTIDTDTGIIAGAVSGSEMQVDVITMPTVTVTGTINNEPDGTALSNGQVTVDTTAGGVTIVSASAGRQGVMLTNQGSVACYIGTGTVSSSNGYYLGVGESVSIPTDSDVKGITASSSTTVGYLALA